MLWTKMFYMPVPRLKDWLGIAKTHFPTACKLCPVSHSKCRAFCIEISNTDPNITEVNGISFLALTALEHYTKRN